MRKFMNIMLTVAEAVADLGICALILNAIVHV